MEYMKMYDYVNIQYNLKIKAYDRRVKYNIEVYILLLSK